MDKAMMMEFVWVIVGTLWASVGPLATSAITSWVNSIVGKYVPVAVQVVLSSVVTAVAAALSAPLVGIDPMTGAAIGTALGAGNQTFAALQPKTMLTGTTAVKGK